MLQVAITVRGRLLGSIFTSHTLAAHAIIRCTTVLGSRLSAATCFSVYTYSHVRALLRGIGSRAPMLPLTC